MSANDHPAAEEQLRFAQALLAAQNEASPDGILVVEVERLHVEPTAVGKGAADGGAMLEQISSMVQELTEQA